MPTPTRNLLNEFKNAVKEIEKQVVKADNQPTNQVNLANQLNGGNIDSLTQQISYLQNALKGDGFVTYPNSARQETAINQNFNIQEWVKNMSGVISDEWRANLTKLAKKHPEMFRSEADVFRVIKEIKDNPTHFFKNYDDDVALIGKQINDNKFANIGIVKNDGEIIHANKNKIKDLDRLQRRNKEMLTGTPLPATTRANNSMGGDLLQHSNAQTIPNQSIKQAENQANLVKKENERLLKRNSYPVGSPTPTQLTFGKTAEPTANGAKALLGKKEKAVSGDALPPHLDADNTSLTGRYSVGGKPHLTAFEKGNPQSFTEADFMAKSDNLLTNPNKNSTPKELLSQGQMPAGWMKGSTNIGSSTEQPKWANKFKTKMAKMGQEYNDEKIANLANWHKDSHAVTKESDGSPKVFYHGTNAKFDAFDIDKSKGGWLGKSFYFTDGKGKAKGYGKNVISTYLNLKNPYISKANDHYSFVNEVKEQFGVKENYGEFDPAQVLKQHGYDGVVYKDWNDEVGIIYTAFSPNQIKSITNKGTFNPNSNLIDGFSTMAIQKAILHLGSGGIGGAMNANAEQDPNKKAEAFVKGFLLGAGGSVGAIKMLENSAKLAPQLARTSQRLAKDLPMILNDRPDIVGKVLGKTPKENYNYIFGGENAIGANKAKLKTAVEMAKNGADESEIWGKTGWYKDIDKKWKFEINPQGGELDISALKKATPNKLGDILKDDELFKAYPQVKDLSILPTQTKDGANAIYHEAFGSRQKAIFFDYDYLQNATNDEIRSTLYHEIQHAIQSIEGFASGGSTQKLSYEEYKNLAGESEARNVEKRLNRTYSKDDAIDGEFNRLLINDIDNPKWQELKQKRTELVLAGKQDEADKIKKQLDQRQEFLKKEAVKNVERFSSYSPHPFKTLDINPNDRVVKYGSGMSASYTPKQKEVRGVYNVAFNEKRATQIYKDIEDVENVIKFEKGRADNISANKDGFGSLHIQKHLDPKNEGYITTQEYLNMGEYIRKAGDFKESGGKRVYDYTDENGVRFRAIIGDTRGGKDRVISFFSNRKAGSAYDRQNYTRNQPLSENSTPKEIKSQAQVEQKAKQYAKWLSQADKIPPQAPDELYKAYDKAKKDLKPKK
ncbi:LPD23 domain-containing protein [Campylobacter devanensis]|uniref:ADP-ribosyltransferase-containing protein n=1 Tax=Campylobacter devanensis TaxID=3161138 RepID=UPI000A3336AF|nr:LPD23 domain-containing protein [Campylobacter sp. P0087]